MLTDPKNRIHTCCFTGHRPEKLTQTEDEIKPLLETQIRQAIDDGFNIFISGVSKGVDLWAAEIVIKLRSSGLPIKLVCASPYRDFEKYWAQDWKNKYNQVLANADETHFISSSFRKGCYHIRNRWLVDHSERIIAVYNGEIGGTEKTIKYAEKQDVPVYNILN